MSVIRCHSARLHPGTGIGFSGVSVPFSQGEYQEVINNLNINSRCLRLCYAAHKVDALGNAQLTLALMNFSLRLQISPSTGLGRDSFLLRKKGPRVVTNVALLTPFSLVSDLASILDGLVAVRKSSQLQDYWGSCQFGGRYESLFSLYL